LQGDEKDEPAEEEEEEVELHTDNHIHLDALFGRSGNLAGPARSLTEAHDFAKLSRNLEKRANLIRAGSDVSMTGSHDASAESEDSDHHTHTEDVDDSPDDRRSSFARRRSSRARFENKVLGRLYSRRAFTGGLVFSRGHFLGDVSKMVAGLLSSRNLEDDHPSSKDDSSFPKYGFGDTHEGAGSNGGSGIMENLTDMVIREVTEDESNIVHTSTLTAGKEGCVALVFPKANLIPFLDEYPGLLLSLLGTQVVV
jgi:hypothetical protein